MAFIEIHNPWNGELVGRLPETTAEGVASALEAAVATHPKHRSTALHERATWLDATADLLQSRLEEGAQIIRREAGKPITLARGEVTRAVQTFRLSAAWCRTGDWSRGFEMSATPQGVGYRGWAKRVPLGLIFAITPFNFPLNLVAHKIAPAIATGNTVLLKPTPRTPLIAVWLLDLLREAGLPEGWISLLVAQPAACEALYDDARVPMLSFTGSAPVGWGLKARCAKKRITLELGGTAPLIVCADAEWETRVASVNAAAFGYAGQSCISVQQVFVESGVAAAFTEALVAHAKTFPTGDPALPETLCGPMIDAAAADRVERVVKSALEAGAVALLQPRRESPTMLTPGILTNVPSDHALVDEEIFGPILVLQNIEHWREAAAMINASRFGIHAGIWTRDLATAESAFQEIETGGVLINETPTFRTENLPYGGVRESGCGREGIPWACEDMTDWKSCVVRVQA